jgi:hypothetical protein
MNQGTKWVLLMQKNRRRKSHAWAPLRIYIGFGLLVYFHLCGTLQENYLPVAWYETIHTIYTVQVGAMLLCPWRDVPCCSKLSLYQCVPWLITSLAHCVPRYMIYFCFFCPHILWPCIERPWTVYNFCSLFSLFYNVPVDIISLICLAPVCTLCKMYKKQ